MPAHFALEIIISRKEIIKRKSREENNFTRSLEFSPNERRSLKNTKKDTRHFKGGTSRLA